MAKNPELMRKNADGKVVHQNYNGVCQQDTDSNYVCFHEFVDKYLQADLTDEQILEFFLELDTEVVQPFFDNALEWRAKQIGVENKLFFKREAIAKSFISLGKKKYSLNILADEKKRYVGLGAPKIKHKGVELVQSATPPFVKEHVPKLVMICLDPTAEYKELAAELYKLHKMYKKQSYNDLAKVSNLKKYDKYAYSSNWYAKHGLKIRKGTPIATRAAINHNFVINAEGLNVFEVNNSSKVHFIAIEGRNKFNVDAIAWQGDFPEEFFKYFKIDYATQFEKTVLNIVNRYAKARGWGEIQYKQLNSFLFFGGK